MAVDPNTGIYFELHGQGAPLFIGLPLMASHVEIFGDESASMLAAWIDALGARHRILLADYPSIGRSVDLPPDQMTAGRVCEDLLSVATAAGFDRFAWAGYSWSAAVGLQLATRSSRVSALAIGGWPPLGGPYANILAATIARIDHVPDSSKVILRTDDQYRQWSTFYDSLKNWPETTAVAGITGPKMLYFGANGDLVEAGYPVPIATACRTRRDALEAQGWQVHEIAGWGHEVIGQSELILPLLRQFLDNAHGSST